MIIIRLLLPLVFLVLTGCASTSSYRNPKDPLEPLNRSIYKFNDTVDKVVLKPVAQGYKAVVPQTGRTMVHNFFSNLDDIVVTLNDLLQFKFRQAFSDSGRVLINTSVGAFGLVDVASKTGYPKHDEDFGQTLGYWGVENGPYLMLPFLGPSTLRDSIGLYVDSRPSRIRRINDMRARNQLYLLDAVRARSELLDQEGILGQAVLDPYSFMRDAYLLHRRSLVYDGHPPRIKYDDENYGYDDGGDKGDQFSANDAKAVPMAHTVTPSASTAAAPARLQPAVQKVWVTAQH
jgi:phospholipid-binding lipoprotein MlaA